MSNVKENGFTTIEVLIAVLIIAFLGAVVVTDFALQKKRTDLKASMQEMVGVVRLAQSKTLASESNSQYGVYLDTVALPQKYVLFKGVSYAARDSAYDVTYVLPSTMEFFPVSLGGQSQIVFDKLTGASEQSGSVSLRLKSDTSQTQTFYIASSGAVSFSALPVASDEARVKDSRHVHFDYNRTIPIDANNNVSETITCTFYKNDGNTVVTTIGAGTLQLVAGQIDTSCSASVDGASQTVNIHTHHLNDGTYINKNQFSMHRDKRNNTKRVKITLSGDNSGNLVDYSADGLTTTHSSIYVLNFAWQ